MNKSPGVYVFEARELLKAGLIPFVEKRLRFAFPKKKWQEELNRRLRIQTKADGTILWDIQNLLKTMDVLWQDAFSSIRNLGRTERAHVVELIGVRNKHSHDGNFSCDDAKRALETMRLLLEAVGANNQAKQIADLRACLRAECDEHARKEERRISPVPTSTPNDNLKDVLAYVLGGHADELSNTRLNNVVYLADWHHAQKYRKTITGIRWCFSRFGGMYVRAVEDTAKDDQDTFTIEHKGERGKEKYFSLKDKSFQPQLGAEEVETLDSIIGETASLSREAFEERVNKTHPMQFFEPRKPIDLVKKAKEQQRS